MQEEIIFISQISDMIHSNLLKCFIYNGIQIQTWETGPASNKLAQTWTLILAAQH